MCGYVYVRGVACCNINILKVKRVDVLKTECLKGTQEAMSFECMRI